MDTTAADPLVGTLLDGRYRVGHRIARGGMATVYEATDTRLDRQVAVKVMHATYARDDAFVARFVREARSAARLSHPNVVGVFDQGDDHGTLFLAMEYVPGRTLRDVVRDHAPLPPAQAVALLEPVVSALAAAHEAGFVHRDVKPENVLITDDGRVKVADFGLVRAVTTASSTATSGVVLGTVSYLAPELVTDGTADTRCDVYSAGVLLYELLTGRKPHQGETPIQVAYKHVHENVPAPSEVVDGVPPYLDALVARATARRRAARPADAKVLLQQLRRVRHALAHGVDDDPELTEDLGLTEREDGTEPTLAVPQLPGDAAPWGPAAPPVRRSPGSPPSPRTETPRTARRRRRRAGWVALVVVLLLAAGAAAGGWYLAVGRFSSTPALAGMTVAQARDQLGSSGLRLAVGTPAYSETVPEGVIVSTEPAAGQRVLREGTVTVVVSRGKERYAMPPVLGTAEAEARVALTEGGLAVGEVARRYSEKVDEGLVVAASYEEGARLRPDTAVDLVVSRGQRPIRVPDLVGRSQRSARDALTGRGLRVNVSRTYDDAVPRGEVIGQEPADGTLFRSDEVALVVSKGPRMAEVPGVFGRYRDDAVATLESAGFDVDVQHADGYVGFDLVSSQSPRASEPAPRGSTVTIFLY